MLVCFPVPSYASRICFSLQLSATPMARRRIPSINVSTRQSREFLYISSLIPWCTASLTLSPIPIPTALCVKEKVATIFSHRFKRINLQDFFKLEIMGYFTSATKSNFHKGHSRFRSSCYCALPLLQGYFQHRMEI